MPRPRIAPRPFAFSVTTIIVIPGEDRARCARSEGREAMAKRYFVYLLASKRNGTLYVGVTGDLANRTWQHKSDLIEGFTKRYGVHTLVWFEEHGDICDTIDREKQIKGWNRAWKIRLIEKQNPDWNDLYEDFIR
jgi:putative endonuclease